MYSSVTYNTARGTALFRGPGGHTETVMDFATAQAIASTMRADFKVVSGLER